MREVGNAERQGDYARAIELTAEVLAEDVSSQGEASEDALRSRMLLARLLDAAGRWEESEERFEEVGRLLGPPAADERSNLRISWMLTRGELAEARDDVEEATHWYGRIAENCPGWPPDPDAGFCARLGWLRRWRMYADRGLAERALPLTDKAWVEVHPDPLAPERPEFIAAAEAYHRFGAYPEAIAWTEASEDVWKKRRALGDDNEVFIRSGFLRGVGISIGRFYQFAPMGTEARIEALVRLGRQDEARRLETRDLAYWSRPDRFEEILTANIEHHGERPESAQDYSYAYEARGYYRWTKRRCADSSSRNTAPPRPKSSKAGMWTPTCVSFRHWRQFKLSAATTGRRVTRSKP
jgi:tetratricopeptide (TPR) repeat protein